MTLKEGEAAAGESTTPAGASDAPPSDTEVTKLTEQLAVSVALVTERDAQLVTAEETLTELRTANTKFADDAVSLADKDKQLADANTALEESRKTSATQLEQIEAGTTREAALQGTVNSRRKADLITRLGLTDEYVAGLDDAALTTLEGAPINIPTGTTNGKLATDGLGNGLDSGGATTNIGDMPEAERMLAAVTRLKEPK